MRQGAYPGATTLSCCLIYVVILYWSKYLCMSIVLALQESFEFSLDIYLCMASLSGVKILEKGDQGPSPALALVK